MDFSKLSLNDLRDFLESYEQVPSDNPDELADQASQLYELAYTTYGDEAVYPESVLDLFLATNYIINGGTVDQTYHPSYLEHADHEFLEALSLAFDLASTSSEVIDDETARRRVIRILTILGAIEDDDAKAEEFLRSNGPLEERYDPLTILYDNGSLALDFATALGLPQEDTPLNRDRIVRFLNRLNGLWTEADYNTEIVTLAQNYLDNGGSIDQTYTESEIYNFDSDTIAVFTSLFGLLPVDIPEIRTRIIGILKILGVVHADESDEVQIKSVVRPNTPIISPVVPETTDSPIPLTPVTTPSFIMPLTGPQVSLVSSEEIPVSIDEEPSEESVNEVLPEELVVQEVPVDQQTLESVSELIQNESTVCEEIEPAVIVCKVPLSEVVTEDGDSFAEVVLDKLASQIEEPVPEVIPEEEVVQIEEVVPEEEVIQVDDVVQVEEVVPIEEVVPEEEIVPEEEAVQSEEVVFEEIIPEIIQVEEVIPEEPPAQEEVTIQLVPEVTLVEEILSLEEVVLNLSPGVESISILLTEQPPSHQSPLKLPSSISPRSSPHVHPVTKKSPSRNRVEYESILSPSATTPRVGLLVELPDPVDLIIDEEPLPGTLTPVRRSPYSPQTMARNIPLPPSPLQNSPLTLSLYTPLITEQELPRIIGPRVTLSPRAKTTPVEISSPTAEDREEENMSPFIMIGSPPLMEEGMMSPDSSLVSASGRGDLNAIEAAVDSGALAFNQAFLNAATAGQEEVVSELIAKHFGDITQTIVEQSTEVAGERGHLGVLEDLMAYDESLNGRAAHGLGLGGHLEQLETLELTKYAGDFLVGAAQSNHLDVVQQTLNQYPDIASEMKDRALLSAALADQDSEIYLILFRQGGTAKGLKEAYGQALTRGGHPNSVKRLRTLVPN